MAAGFGCGCCFIVALGTSVKAIPSNPGLGVALPGTCMSLSLGFTVFYLGLYTDYSSDCDNDPNCWSYQILAQAIMIMICYFVGGALIMIANTLNTVYVKGKKKKFYF